MTPPWAAADDARRAIAAREVNILENVTQEVEDETVCGGRPGYYLYLSPSL